MVVAEWRAGEVFWAMRWFSLLLLPLLGLFAYLIARGDKIGHLAYGDAQRADSATAPPSVRWDTRHEGGRQPWVFSIR
jgi:hypothetical protein